MFRLNKIETCIFLAAMILVICLPTDCFAENFSSLRNTGMTIFTGLRSIIYPASAIGIICVCIGGFFGNINWKWFTAVVVGLIVISLCGGFIELFVGKNETLNNLDKTNTLDGE